MGRPGPYSPEEQKQTRMRALYTDKYSQDPSITLRQFQVETATEVYRQPGVPYSIARDIKISKT